MLVFLLCLLAFVQAESTSPVDPGEQSLIEQIENRRVETIRLLNDTDAYDMATTISANVADTLKFFDDLGTLFRNGTLATCMENDEGKTWCNHYALLNGSVPLKNSVIRLMFDVFNMTLGKYHIDLEEEKPAKKAVRNWFSSAIANERRRKVPSFLITSFTFLADAFYEGVIGKVWRRYSQLLVGDQGLKNLDKSTRQNHTGRNITAEFRTDGVCSILIGTYESESDVVLQLVDDLMGPRCANDSDGIHIRNIRSLMEDIAITRNLNGGVANRCFPEFLVRCTDYDEVIYKTFITDISSFIHLELITAGLCLGMSPMNGSGRQQHRSRWAEHVHAIMKQIRNARHVLKEIPPSQAVDEAVTNAVANVGAKIAPLSWKDRPAFYDKAIRAAIRNLKLDDDSSWSSTM